jgi:hypothetical protein
MAADMGHQLKFAIATAIPLATPTTSAIEISEESLKLTEVVSDASGLRGTRSHSDVRARKVSRAVAGSVTLQPTPADLDVILPYLLGGVKSGTDTPLAESLADFFAAIKRDATCFTYSGCKINKATFSASAGQFLNLSLDIVGKDETTTETFPTVTYTTQSPFICSDCAVVVGGVTYAFESFSLTVENFLESKAFNSITPTRINATDRAVTWGFTFPSGDTTAIYGIASAAVSATFTNGTVSLAINSAKVLAPKESPTVGSSRAEIMRPWNGVARRPTAGTDEVVFSVDSTP